MEFQNSAIEVMRKRQSIRTYETQKIDQDIINIITEYICTESNLIGPNGKKGRIELIPITNNTSDKGIKLGTYGFIKNPGAYLVGITENNKQSLLDLAYNFHKLVHHLTDLGIGTCWIGGTFDRDSFEKEIFLGEGEFIACITPIGYPKNKQRIFDKAVRMAAKSDQRKPWEQLFYDEKFEAILTKENAGQFETPLEMVRLGPSASNKQPWRLVLSPDKKVCHFYIEHTPNYSAKLRYDMQMLDLGIAMCQFDLACQELNLHGQWKLEDPNVNLPSEHAEYIISWKLAD